MTTRLRYLTFAALLIMIASSVPAQANIKYIHKDKEAKSGIRTNIEHTSEVNLDCSVKAIPSVKIVVPPSHGRLSEVRSKDFVHFVPPNPRVRCDSHKIDGLTFYYTSNPKFVGRDSIELDIAFSTGSLDDVKLDIDVR